jgi:hypothetical protein
MILRFAQNHPNNKFSSDGFENNAKFRFSSKNKQPNWIPSVFFYKYQGLIAITAISWDDTKRIVIVKARFLFDFTFQKRIRMQSGIA